MKSNKKIIALIGIIFTICISAIAVTSLTGNSGQNTIQAALATGEKYLDQLEYDKAIATYESIIKIDSKCVDAYLGISQAYEAKGEVLKAAQTITLAYPMVEPEDRVTLEDRLKELAELYEEVKAAIENGTLVLSPDIDKEAFDIFFHLLVNNTEESETDSGNNDSAFYHIDAEFPLEIFDYSVYGKSLDEWDYDSLKQYALTYMELDEELSQHLDNGGLLYVDDLTGMYIWPIPNDPTENNRGTDLEIVTNTGNFNYSLNQYNHFATYIEKSWYIREDTVFGQLVEDYLEAVYPGLYDTLSTQKMVRFNNCYITFDINPDTERPLVDFYWENKVVSINCGIIDPNEKGISTFNIRYTNDTYIFPWEE